MSYRKHLMTSDEPPSELYKATEVGTNLAEVGTDCISRQQAIDALNAEIMKRRLLDDINDGKLDEFDTESIIRQLPPIQPKIIRCKNCKWNRTENRKDTTQWLPCRALVTPDDFSCIYAERRTE